jgi:hypothetical protein
MNDDFELFPSFDNAMDLMDKRLFGPIKRNKKEQKILNFYVPQMNDIEQHSQCLKCPKYHSSFYSFGFSFFCEPKFKK